MERKKKAAQFNIPLRRLERITDDEVRTWATATGIKIIYYEFTDNVVMFTLERQGRGIILTDPLTIENEDGGEIDWRGMFEPLMNDFDADPELDTHAKEFDVEIFAPLLVCGMRPLKITLKSTVQRVTRDLLLNTILKYLAPDAGEGAHDIATVEKRGGGIFEVIQSSDEVAITTDASFVEVPSNCFFHSLLMDFGGPILMKWVQLVQPKKALSSNVSIRFALRIVASRPSTSVPDAEPQSADG